MYTIAWKTTQISKPPVSAEELGSVYWAVCCPLRFKTIKVQKGVILIPMQFCTFVAPIKIRSIHLKGHMMSSASAHVDEQDIGAAGLV